MNKKPKITAPLIQQATGARAWDIGNNTLYDLCRKYPDHTDDKAIIAKVWIIGRTYSAAIERRKPGKAPTPTGDGFYTDHVAPGIRNSPMDEWLSRLMPRGSVNYNSLPQILDAHAKVTELFRSLTGLNKRSLASKYLHFHFPTLFFIYDTRAVDAVRKLSAITAPTSDYGEADKEYGPFAERCLQIRDYIKEQYGSTLTPRQLDNLYLDLSLQ